MLYKLKTILKHTLIYSLGNISTKLVGFVLLPLYTTFLSINEYGIFAILEISTTVIVALFSFGLSTTMMRWCSVEKNASKLKSIVFTTYITSLLIVFSLNVLLYPFHESLSFLFFDTSAYKLYFLVLITSGSFEILNLISLDLIRLKEKPYLYIFVTISKIIVVLSLNIYFIKYQNLGILGILISSLIGNVLTTLITVPILLKNMIPKYNVKELASMFNYGFPLIFMSISMILLTMSDRYIIKYYLDYSQVGIYSLGYKIASVINVFIIQSFQTGFLPIAYKNFDKQDANRFFSKTLTYYTYVLVFCSLGLSLFSQEIIEIFSKNTDYFSAYTIVPFIALAFVFKGIQYIYSLGMHFMKKTKYNAIVVLGAALLNISLNFVLVPLYGIYGAAAATIISWIFMSFAFYRYTMKYYKIDYELKKIVLLVLIGIMLFLLSYTFSEVQFYLKIVLKALLFIMFPFILFVFNFYEKIEILRIKEILIKRKIKSDK